MHGPSLAHRPGAALGRPARPGRLARSGRPGARPGTVWAVMLGGIVLFAAACRTSVGSGSGAPGPASTVTPATSHAGELSYVALGDSYTIGTSVEPPDRWPEQLVATLRGRQPSLRLLRNLGVNGATSRDVVERQLPALDALQPEFVSLLIGVNDVVQGVPASRYTEHAAVILDDLRSRLPADRIVVVSTPDYTVTPEGASFGDPAVKAAAIVENNAILEGLARDRGIAWVDIHDISLRAADERSLVASDGLHPSGEQYALWVERIAPVVARLLGR